MVNVVNNHKSRHKKMEYGLTVCIEADERGLDKGIERQSIQDALNNSSAAPR